MNSIALPSPPRHPLSSLSVLITGASRGLGAALFIALAKRGARVVGVARDAEGLGRVVSEARALGADAYGLVFDVADKESTHRIAGAAAALVGAIDVLVNNAGTLGPTPLRPLSDTACEDLERALQVNVLGPFRLTKVLANAMAVRGRGLVIHVTSDAASSAYPTWGAYGASKAAFDHAMRVWSEEVHPLGVRFFNVDPGEMDTKMHADAIPDADRSTLARPERVAEHIAALIANADAHASGSRIDAARVPLLPEAAPLRDAQPPAPSAMVLS